MRYKNTEQELRDVVARCLSIAQVCRELGIKAAGGNYKTLRSKLKEFNISIDHFTGQGWNVGLKFVPNPPVKLYQICVPNSTYKSSNGLKNKILKEGIRTHSCEICKKKTWQRRSIPLELHHINGITNDNRLVNLQLLCPNCHAQTDNYRGKNKCSSGENG